MSLLLQNNCIRTNENGYNMECRQEIIKIYRSDNVQKINIFGHRYIVKPRALIIGGVLEVIGGTLLFCGIPYLIALIFR